MRGRLPASTKKLLGLETVLAADQGRHQQFDHQGQHRALGAADARRSAASNRPARPRRRWSAGPAASSAQPAGIGSPFFAATITLPRATSDRLRSIISGSGLAARENRGHRVGAEDRVPATGRRHRRRRVGKAQAHHAGRGHRRAGGRRRHRSGGCSSRRRRPRPGARAAATASAIARSQAGKARPSLGVDQQRRRRAAGDARRPRLPRARPLRR